MSSTSSEAASAAEHNKPQIKSEVLSEKHRREEHIRQLELDANYEIGSPVYTIGNVYGQGIAIRDGIVVIPRAAVLAPGTVI